MLERQPRVVLNQVVNLPALMESLFIDNPNQPLAKTRHAAVQLHQTDDSSKAQHFRRVKLARAEQSGTSPHYAECLH